MIQKFMPFSFLRTPGAIVLLLCTILSASATTTHEYDALGRLVVTEYDDDNDNVIDRRIEYSYDAAGNRTQVVTSGDLDPPNNAPQGVDDGSSGSGMTVTHNAIDYALDVIANDTDADNDTLTVSSITTAASNGTATVGTGGANVLYTPNTNYSGADSFVYELTDGEDTSTATVYVEVDAPANNAPVAVDDGTGTAVAIAHNTATMIDVLANDTDVDNDTLTVTAKTDGSDGTVTIGTGGANVTYTPDTNTSGADSFTYTISDGNGGSDTGTVYVDVAAAPSNNPPNAVNDSASTLPGGFQVTVNVIANDSDPDSDALTITSAPGGTIQGDGVSIHYDVSGIGFGNTAYFTYHISDGNGGTDSATVAVTRAGMGGWE